ncbi:MAG: ABC transporter permease [Thermoprotei archaeon]|nr:MAG: ABC transporter permease [Thermoprotei archaeon]
MSAVKAVLKAYFTAELLRNKGIVFGLLGLALWLSLFLAPLTLFRPPQVPAGAIASQVLVSIAIFLAYSSATWDWAWQIRWLLFEGILEHVIASGRSIFILYIGIVPISLMWYAAALAVGYLTISLLVSPPTISVVDPAALVLGVLTLAAVLFGYSMLLGGITISTGTSGPVMEFVGWILPIATGGIVPLRALPEIVQRFALTTPFSYPAELLRHALGLSTPILPLKTTSIVGSFYAFMFLVAALAYFKAQLKKMLREGVKTAWMY